MREREEDANITPWLEDVFVAINGPGRLAPPRASQKRVSAFLSSVDGEEFLQVATTLGVGEPQAVRQLAGEEPELGRFLCGEEQQQAIDEWFERNRCLTEPYCKVVRQLMRLVTPGTSASFADAGECGPGAGEAWGKVFEILTGKDRSVEGSSNI